MREILFRGKRIDNGEWEYGYYVRFGATGSERAYILPRYASALYVVEVIPETVGQYTELNDKIVNKIFEGDIVNILTEVDEIGVIEWADTEAMFVVVADCWCANFDNYYGYDLEVIGNIHDNPELLSGGEV